MNSSLLERAVVALEAIADAMSEPSLVFGVIRSGSFRVQFDPARVIKDPIGGFFLFEVLDKKGNTHELELWILHPSDQARVRRDNFLIHRLGLALGITGKIEPEYLVGHEVGLILHGKRIVDFTLHPMRIREHMPAPFE